MPLSNFLGSFPILTILVAVISFFCAGGHAFADRWFGFGAGGATTLVPTKPGIWAAASAATEPEMQQSGVTIAGRGSLNGAMGDGHWAVLPQLTGEGGLSIGPVRLFLEAGVELFGFARRDGWTIFAPFGVIGGGGLTVGLSDDLRLGLRAQICWLPEATNGRMKEPDGQDKGSLPTFLLVGGVISVELRRPFAEF